MRLDLELGGGGFFLDLFLECFVVYIIYRAHIVNRSSLISCRLACVQHVQFLHPCHSVLEQVHCYVPCLQLPWPSSP